MNRDSKEFKEARIISETILAFIIYLRFGGESAWKDPITVDGSYALAKIFISRMDTDLDKCKNEKK